MEHRYATRGQCVHTPDPFDANEARYRTAQPLLSEAGDITANAGAAAVREAADGGARLALVPAPAGCALVIVSVAFLTLLRRAVRAMWLPAPTRSVPVAVPVAASAAS